MRKYILFFIFTLPMAATAQQIDSSWSAKKFHHQVGINATLFIKQFLSFNSSAIQEDPFSVTYKLFKSNSEGNRLMGARIGLGYMNFSETDNSNPDVKRTTTFNNISAKLGLEMQQKIASRWNVFYGLDGIYLTEIVSSSSNFNNNNNGTFTTSTKSEVTNFGGGPFLGIQFNINKRISLSTESAFYFLEGKAKESFKTDFPGSTQPESRSSSQKTISFVAPAFINFNIMF